MRQIIDEAERQGARAQAEGRRSLRKEIANLTEQFQQQWRPKLS